MNATTLDATAPTATAHGDGPVRIACAVGALLALVPLALCSFSGDTGAEITASVRDDAAALQGGAAAAALAGALLVVAALRLAASVPGLAGRVMAASGVATAVLFVAYYAAFGAAGVTADHVVTDPGAGLGEATAALVNMAELTRYAPGLALAGAAVAGRRHLPAGVWIVAVVLAVATLVPFTSWGAALLMPLWLGVSAAVVRGRG